MATIKYNLDPNRKLTKQEIEMIENASKLPYIPDEDSPELSDAQIAEFKKIISERKALKKKETVSLRLSTSTLNAAKSLDKSYTSILATVLENIFKDPKALKKYL